MAPAGESDDDNRPGRSSAAKTETYPNLRLSMVTFFRLSSHLRSRGAALQLSGDPVREAAWIPKLGLRPPNSGGFAGLCPVMVHPRSFAIAGPTASALCHPTR